MSSTYDSGADRSASQRSATGAHGDHREEIGHPDPERPDRSAQDLVDQQPGRCHLASPGPSA